MNSREVTYLKAYNEHVRRFRIAEDAHKRPEMRRSEKASLEFNKALSAVLSNPSPLSGESVKLPYAANLTLLLQVHR
jgi:hypothetical protein